MMRARALGVFLLLSAAAAASSACSDAPRCVTCPGPATEPDTTTPPPSERPAHLAITRVMGFGDSQTEGEASGTLRMYPTHDPGTAGDPRSYPAQLLGLLVGRYPDQAQAFRVFNGGIGGRQAVTDVNRFEDYLKAYNPQVVILLHGVNDLNSGVGIAEIITAIEAMVREAQKRGVDVLLSTLPQQRPGAQRAFAVQRIVPFNEELRDTATDLGVTLVDIYPHITLDMLTTDGLHITPAGNGTLAGIYLNALRARYEIEAP